jgi:hypothetical protein
MISLEFQCRFIIHSRAEELLAAKKPLPDENARYETFLLLPLCSRIPSDVRTQAGMISSHFESLPINHRALAGIQARQVWVMISSTTFVSGLKLATLIIRAIKKFQLKIKLFSHASIMAVSLPFRGFIAAIDESKRTESMNSDMIGLVFVPHIQLSLMSADLSARTETFICPFTTWAKMLSKSHRPRKKSKTKSLSKQSKFDVYGSLSAPFVVVVLSQNIFFAVLQVLISLWLVYWWQESAK